MEDNNLSTDVAPQVYLKVDPLKSLLIVVYTTAVEDIPSSATSNILLVSVVGVLKAINAWY